MSSYTPLRVSATAKNIGSIQERSTYYIDITNSLRVDENFRTLWIDLDSQRLSKDYTLVNSVPIFRKDSGSKEDFLLKGIPEFYKDKEGKTLMRWHSFKELHELFEIFILGGEKRVFSREEENLEIFVKGFSLLDRIDYLRNFANSEEQIPIKSLEKARKIIQKNKEGFLTILQYFEDFIQKNVKKESIDTLIEQGNYSLVFGELSPDEYMENISFTLQSSFRELDPQRVEDLLFRTLDGIAISNRGIDEIIEGLGLARWPVGLAPKKGGCLFHDYGGTGKSLFVERFKEFVKRLGPEFNLNSEEIPYVEEVSTSEISSYSNAGPQIVKRWFMGYDGQPDHISGKKPDLVKISRERRMPSFLIIDEAKDLILADSARGHNDTNLNTSTSIKRFVQDIKKGGVVGNVIVIMIANMTIDQVDSPIIQRGERLTPVWFGHPRSIEHWNNVIEYHINDKNLNFRQNSVSLEHLSRLLIRNLELIRAQMNNPPNNAEEINAVDQRSFGDHMGSFAGNLNVRNSNASGWRSLAAKAIFNRDNQNQTRVQLNFRDLMVDVIENLLLFNVRNKNIGDETTFRDEFQAILDDYDTAILGQTNSQQQTSQQQNIVQQSTTQQQNNTNSIIDNQQLDSAKNQCFNFIRIQQQLFANNQFSESNFIRDFPVINTAFTTILQRAQQTNFSHYQTLSGIINQLNQYSQNQITIPLADLQRILTILQNLIPRIQ